MTDGRTSATLARHLPKRMRRLIHHNARILTLAGGARRGLAMRDLGVIGRGHIVCEDGRIASDTRREAVGAS